MIQNQHGAGKVSKKWDKTGVILENLGYNKYRVKVDGSGRVTDRNRQFLRQFTPVTSIQPGPHPEASYVPEPIVEPHSDIAIDPRPVNQPQQPIQIIPNLPPEPQIPNTPEPVASPQQEPPTTPESPSFVTPPTTPVAPGPPRRSTRVNLGIPPERLNYDKF